MKSRSGHGPSQRQLRAGELLKHALAEIFSTVDIADESLRQRVLTVAEVRMSPDLKHASVFVSALGGDDTDGIAQALNRHQKFLRGELARRVELKYVPELVFRGDHAMEAVERIDKLLRSPDVLRDLK